MRAIVCFFGFLLICGCAVIINEDDKVRYFGIGEEEALDTLERIEEKEDEEKHEIRIFNRQEEE